MSKFNVKNVLAGLFGCEKSAIKDTWLSDPSTIPPELFPVRVTNHVIISIAKWKAANTLKRTRLLFALLQTDAPAAGHVKEARLAWETVESQHVKLGRSTNAGIEYLKASFDSSRLLRLPVPLPVSQTDLPVLPKTAGAVKDIGAGDCCTSDESQLNVSTLKLNRNRPEVVSKQLRTSEPKIKYCVRTKIVKQVIPDKNTERREKRWKKSYHDILKELQKAKVLENLTLNY